jgi:hypothetical protein
MIALIRIKLLNNTHNANTTQVKNKKIICDALCKSRLIPAFDTEQIHVIACNTRGFGSVGIYHDVYPIQR